MGRLGFWLSNSKTDQNKRHEVRQRLESLLGDHNTRVRAAAIRGLGFLGDPQALPVLERIQAGKTGDFALAGRDRSRAQVSIRDILYHQASLAGGTDLKQRLQALESQNQKLQTEIAEIREKLGSGNKSNRESVTQR